MSIAKWLLAKKLAGGGSPFPPVIKRVTGNPIEFSDGADAPLVKCTTEIQGSQDLHGYDKPWVGGAGKNKFNQADTTTDGLSNTDGTYTNTLTDSKTSYQPAVRWYKNGTFVNANTGTNITSSGRYRLTVNAGGQEYDEIRFGHNGSTRDLIISYPLGYSTTNITTISFTVGGFNPSVVGGLTISEIELEVGQKTTPDPYYPYSNICPITAYTEGEIEVRGKNWCDGVNAGLYINGDATYYGYSGTDNGLAIPTEGADYMTVSTTITQTRYRVCVGNINPSTQGNVQAYNGVNKDGTNDSVTISTQGYDYIIVNATDLTKIQVEKGSTATDYEPYTSTTHTTAYPSAIYRGSEDVVNGSVNSNHLRFTVSSGIELYGNYGDDNAPLFYVDMPEYIITYVRAGFSEDVPISNFYNATTGNSVASMHDFEFRTETPPSGTFAKRVYIRDSRFTTAADFNTFIASNPIQFVFKLATEATSSVTPTNLPIRTLSGYNHIESSTGEMEVDYITDAYQNFVDTVESALPNTNTRNLLSASKGGTKAMDIFLSLEKRGDDTAEVKEETKNEEPTER